MTATIDVIARDDAIGSIANHIADRDAFVVVAPPATVDGLADRLAVIPRWTGYVDNGTPAVLRTDQAGLLGIASLLAPVTAVVVVPKTVPAAVLTEALGQEVPDDGSRDLVLLSECDAPPFIWPLLFVDALARVDPKVAATIYANDLAGLS